MDRKKVIVTQLADDVFRGYTANARGETRPISRRKS